MLPKWLLPNPKSIGKHILETLHGFKLIIDPSIDQGVELSLYETGTYEKGILEYIEKNFKSNGIFVDVGANIGLISIFVSRTFPKSRVLAFEAHPITNEILKENIALNSCLNIQTYEVALSDQKGQVELYDNWEVNRGGASFKVNKGSGSGHAVPSDLLDNLLKEDPSMIKIDVEGAELQVLLGAKDVIKRCLPTLIIEISKERDQLDETEAIFYFIQSFNAYSMYKLEGGKERKSKLQLITTTDELPAHDNIICIAHG